jgi:hypothetical protein
MVKNTLEHVGDLRGVDRPYLTGLPVGRIAVAHDLAGERVGLAHAPHLRPCAEFAAARTQGGAVLDPVQR